MSKPAFEPHSHRGDELVADLVHVGAGHRRRHLVDRRPLHVARRHHRPIALIERDVVSFPAELGRALAAGMAELEADLRLGIGVDEIDDALPRGDLGLVPHAGAAGADPALGRDAGHLGEDQPRAAERALAVVDEVEVVGDAVDRRIHRHRRDGDAVLHLHLAQPERREHGRRGLVRAALGRALPEPALDPFQPFAVAQAQVLVADALRAGEERVSELERLEMRVALEGLEPFGRVAGAVLELEHLEVPLGLIFVERGG